MLKYKPNRLCKGLRLAVKKLMNSAIVATILKRKYKSKVFSIPQTNLIPNEIQFQFKRLQIPMPIEL